MIACVNDNHINEDNLYDSGFNAIIKKSDNIKWIETVISNFIQIREAM